MFWIVTLLIFGLFCHLVIRAVKGIIIKIKSNHVDSKCKTDSTSSIHKNKLKAWQEVLLFSILFIVWINLSPDETDTATKSNTNKQVTTEETKQKQPNKSSQSKESTVETDKEKKANTGSKSNNDSSKLANTSKSEKERVYSVISYDELNRNSTKHKGEYVQISGIVHQRIQDDDNKGLLGSLLNSVSTLLIYVDADSSKLARVDYSADYLKEGVVEGDYVIIKGKYGGLTNEELTTGDVSIPFISTLDFDNKAANIGDITVERGGGGQD